MVIAAQAPEVGRQQLQLGDITSVITGLRNMEAGQLALLQVLALQETTRRADPLKELHVRIPHNNPITVLMLGDTHLGSVATDYGMLESLKQYVLNSPTTHVVLLGDLIEGWTRKYMATNQVRALPPEKQIALFQDWLKPLYLTGRIMCSVAEYFGHEAWIVDESGLNVWQRMMGNMNIPIVQNGGIVTLEFRNGHQVRSVVSHNAGGRSRFDPIHSVRNRAVANGVPLSAGAHLHVPGIGAEYVGQSSDSKIISVQSGTAKGVDRNLPSDNHAVRASLGGGGPAGQAVYIRPRTREQHQIVQPVPDTEVAKLLYQALDLLNRTESMGTTDEILEQIMLAYPHPTLRLLDRKSRRMGDEPALEKEQKQRRKEKLQRLEEKKKKTESKTGGDSQSLWFPESPYVRPYHDLVYSIETKLPLVIQPLANLRLGSGSARTKDFSNFIGELSQDPYALTIWLGNILDKTAGQLSNRKQLLDEVVKYLGQIGSNNLGFLLSGSLRRDSWKKALGESPELQPIAPASYISSKSSTPLLENQARVRLQFKGAAGSSEVSIATFDRLLNRASLTAPTKGPMSVYSILTDKPNILMTGHALGAGFAQIFDSSNAYSWPVMLATGWWAEETDMASKGNVVAGARPGACVLVVPKEKGYTLVPMGSMQDRTVFVEAFRLMVGMDQLGLTQKVLRPA